MAMLPTISRARLLLQLIKTGEVASLANYANVELIDPAIGITVADDFYAFDGPPLFDTQDPPQQRDPTNDEKAAHFLKTLRTLCTDRRNAIRAKPAGQAAEEAERAIVLAEIATQLGTD